MTHRFKKLLIAAASSTILSTTAFAADITIQSETVQPEANSYNWNGFYVGIGGGAGAINHELNLLGIDILDGIGAEGLFGEVTVGYDHMISERMLVGAFASYRFGDIATTLDVNLFGGSFDFDLVADRGYDLGARLGFKISPTSLAYVTGGYTHQRFSADGDFGINYEWDADGYFAGAGLETALFGNWTAKAEYRFSQFEEQNIDPFGILSVTPSQHTFHAGLNYRFGGGMTASSAGFAPITYDYTGLKVSAAGGFGAVVHQLDLNLNPILDAQFNGIGGEGMFGEIGLVYDYAFAPNWIIGVGVDYRMSNIKTDIDLSILGSGDITAESGYDVYGRIGYQAMPGTLIYALAGLSYQDFNIDFSTPLFPPIGNALSGLDWSSHGWTVGAGIETAISSKWTAKLEYRYAEYESEDFGTGGVFEITPSIHTVRAGLTYKIF
jgi:outer membrane immunogenic protein